MLNYNIFPIEVDSDVQDRVMSCPKRKLRQARVLAPDFVTCNIDTSIGQQRLHCAIDDYVNSMSIFGPQDEKLSPLASSPHASGDSEPPSSAIEMISDETVSEDEGILDDDDQDRIRYAGSRHKWRRLTRLDRQVAQAQDKLEDEDLSIHLYNAHAIKAHARRNNKKTSKPKVWQSKERWRKREDWVPNKLWTAWPVEETVVPRPGALHTHDSLAQHHPTQELEQCIMACITARARHVMQDELQTEPSMEQPKEDEDMDLTRDTNPSSQSEAEHETILTRQYEGLQDPIPLADDDKLWSLLHPAVRRIVASLDKLLQSLHRAQQNRYGGASDSEAERSLSKSGSESRTRSRSQSRKPSVKRKRKNPEGIKMQRYNFATRDWSELLGHAACSGWDRETIERAATRCSELFDERMELFTTVKPPQAESDSSWSLSGQKEGWPCPEKDCKRHFEPFRLRRSMVKHTEKEHGYSVPWLRTTKGATLEESGLEPVQGNEPEIESKSKYDRMHNGIRLDGFLQPIDIRPEWTSGGT